MQRRTRSSVAITLSALCAASWASAQSPRVLEFASPTQASEPAGQAFAQLARTVEARTRGQLRIRLRFDDWRVLAPRFARHPVEGALLVRDSLDRTCPTAGAWRVAGLFPDVGVMERAFGALRAETEASCGPEATVLGWTLPGPRYLFSMQSLEVVRDRLLTELRGHNGEDARLLGILPPRPSVIPALVTAPVMVAAPGELDTHTAWRYVSATPLGMDLGAVVVPTAIFTSLSPEHQTVLREAVSAMLPSLNRALRNRSPAPTLQRFGEGPAWTAWVQGQRSRARSMGMSRLLARIEAQPGTLPPTAPSTPTTPAPAEAPATAPTTPVPAEPASNPAPSAPVRPRVDFETGSAPDALRAAAYPVHMAAMRPRLLACYQRRLATTPTLEGQITFTLQFAPSGAVSTPQPVAGAPATTLDDAELTACAVSALRGLRLPRSLPDIIPHTQPIVFRLR